MPHAHRARPALHASTPPSFAQRQHARLRWVEALRRQLRSRFLLRLHVFVIAMLMLGALMLGGAGLRAMGVEALAWRYALLLPASYLIYLGLLRVWARALLRHDGSPLDGTPDLLDFGSQLAGSLGRGRAPVPFRSGGGGDFGGGGASGDFSTSASTALSTDLPTPFSTACPSHLSTAGDALGSTGDAVGGLDEGLVIAVPIALILAIGAALGFCVFGLFGVEVLLAVSVEVALASVAGGMAWRRMSEEGWWRCAVRRTWGPALGLLLVGVLLGAAIDHWMPAADSLPHAWQLVRVK
ncbi:hypothetical protein [Roseateles sp. L2-2]|uniref:hypothetical protein n=1 Tax=Roseateles TaxID=93681 RepID=UPI003D35AF71